MTRSRILALAVLLATAFREAEAQSPVLVPLPPDPSAAVIVFDDVSNYGYSTRRTAEPWLMIRANGQVTVQSLYDSSPQLETTLTPSELQDLLRFAIESQGFFTFPREGSYKPVPPEFENLRIVTSHAKRTLIRIRTADRQHESILDLSTLRDPSEQFDAVEKRLLRLIEEIRAGGRGRIVEALRAMNTALSLKHPEILPYSFDDFSSWQPGVPQRFTFKRVLEGKTWQRAVIDYIPGGDSLVSTSTGPLEPSRSRLESGAEFLKELRLKVSP